MFIKKRYPKILFLIVILLSVVCSILYIKNNKEEKIAKIYKDKKLLYTIDLSSVEKPYEIKLGDDENYNIIQVNHNEISIIEASCRDKVCINTGKINNGTVPIVCLPNKVIIEINSNEEQKIDAATY